MLRSLTICLALAFTMTPTSQAASPSRPPIVGTAHITLRVSSLEAARSFYGRELGLAEAFTLGPVTYFKVNDHQYIELIQGLASPNQDRLVRVAYETTDAARLRDYLAAHGIKVPPAATRGEEGNLRFRVTDPDGRDVEFVQYMPGSLHSRNFGKFLPDTRLSQRMIHFGFVIKDRVAADRFYQGILGFEEQWHGGMKDTDTDWVAMRVPDGKDWLEYMLNVNETDPRTLGVMNHLALGVETVDAGYKTILKRGFKPEEEPLIGRDGKWQLSLYDKDFTRTELMEFKPVQKPCCSPIRE